MNAEELVAALRAAAEEWHECCNDVHLLLTVAADRIEVAVALCDRPHGGSMWPVEIREALDGEHA